MLERTQKLWAKQNQHVGDRHRLFRAVAEVIPATTVLYPGSFVDLAPSFVWPDVTYVDVDKRAKRFFGDSQGIDEILLEHGADPTRRTVRFVHGDYTEPLDLPDSSFTLLVSLYAGFVTEHCTRHLQIGGHLVVNPSHGDAAMASLNPFYRLSGVIVSRSGSYTVRTNDLDTYLIPKRDLEVTVDQLHETGRGVVANFSWIFVSPCCVRGCCAGAPPPFMTLDEKRTSTWQTCSIDVWAAPD